MNNNTPETALPSAVQQLHGDLRQYLAVAKSDPTLGRQVIEHDLKTLSALRQDLPAAEIVVRQK